MVDCLCGYVVFDENPGNMLFFPFAQENRRCRPLRHDEEAHNTVYQTRSALLSVAHDGQYHKRRKDVNAVLPEETATHIPVSFPTRPFALYQQRAGSR